MASVLDAVPIGGLRFDSDRIVRAMVLDATTVQLLGSDGMVLPNGQFKAVYKTDWQGQQLQYSTPRTNLALWSQDFTNAAWNTIGVTKAGGVADPYGGTTAATITSTATGGYVYQNVAGVPNLIHTNSIWVRRRTGVGIVNLFTPGQNNVALALGSTWSRFTGSSLPISGTTAQIAVQVVTLGDQVDVAFGQLEVGAAPTPYIPTTTVAVTSTDYVPAGTTVALSTPLIAGGSVGAVPVPFLNVPAPG